MANSSSLGNDLSALLLLVVHRKVSENARFVLGPLNLWKQHVILNDDLFLSIYYIYDNWTIGKMQFNWFE